MHAHAIEITKVDKFYKTPTLKKIHAVRDVSFNVAKGDIFGFLGPNGAGKTSLIKIMVGIMHADSGSCRILGYESGTREAKLKLGYLPERPYFHDFLTAEEFLFFHGRLLGLNDDHIAAQTPKLLERVDLVRARHQRLRTFSKGMLQRIGFAQALLHDPEVLILDEPMSGLDPVGRREMRDIITEISKTGKTILFSTHIIHDVEVICTTVGFINHGTLKGAGNIESLLGKTVKSMEVRFAAATTTLKAARKTMDGWVLDIEAPVDELEDKVDAALKTILQEKGHVRAVIPRKSTLEDLFFGDAQ